MEIRSEQLHAWCESNLLTEGREKKLPDWASVLDNSLGEVLLESLIHGDGCVEGRGPNSQVYVTTSHMLADQVQILAFRLGWRARIAPVPGESRGRKVTYYVHMTRTTTQMLEKPSIRMAPYSGRVYCFNVKNHLFVTRRNGCIAIHGNTAKAAQTVAEEQVFVPERVQMDECINNLLLPEFGITKWAFKTKGPRIVGAGDITTAVKTFTDAGAFTVNHMIDRANEAFGLEMSHFDAIWADYPVPYVVELIKSGQILGPDIIAGLPPVPVAQQALPGGQKPSKQLMLPGVNAAPADSGGPSASPAANPSNAVEKMMASDMFTMEEKGLYKLLLGVQKAIEMGHLTDADLQL